MFVILFDMSLKQEDDEDMIPMDFSVMLHRDYLTKVRITEYNLKGDKFKEFSIDVMTDDADILREYVSISIEVFSVVIRRIKRIIIIMEN